MDVQPSDVIRDLGVLLDSELIVVSWEQSMWAERKTERSGPKLRWSGERVSEKRLEQSGAERGAVGSAERTER